MVSSVPLPNTDLLGRMRRRGGAIETCYVIGEEAARASLGVQFSAVSEGDLGGGHRRWGFTVNSTL